jgi:HSP20 family molecular chaperone IbpA
MSLNATITFDDMTTTTTNQISSPSPSLFNRHRRFIMEQLRRRQQQCQHQGQSRKPSDAPQPAAELAENDAWMRLTVDLPGVVTKDLEVAVANGVLTIQAARRTMSVDATVCIKKQKICRRYAIDTDVIDVTQVKANLANGVLTVKAPKKASQGVVRINAMGGNEAKEARAASAASVTTNVLENQGQPSMPCAVSDEGRATAEANTITATFPSTSVSVCSDTSTSTPAKRENGECRVSLQH